jgi:hypothetical protein
MKPCKACMKEIPDEAYKCSHCRAFQKWYRNPQNISWLLILPIFGYWYWSVSHLGLRDSSKNSYLNPQKYSEFKDQFNAEEVKIVPSDDKKWNAVTYKITNGTDYKWGNLKYEMVGTDDKGKLVYTVSKQVYAWVIHPRSDSFLTVKVERKWKVRSWEFKIMDIEPPIF